MTTELNFYYFLHFEKQIKLYDTKSISFVFVFKVKELQENLNREKSSRTDLEMYVAVLNTQKGVLQEDLDKLRTQLLDGE
jgi:hypothetical protein